MTLPLRSAGSVSEWVVPEEPRMTSFLIASGFSLAMGFGMVCLLVTFRDAFPRPDHTESHPMAQALVGDRSRGQDGDNRKGRGPATSARWTP